MTGADQPTDFWQRLKALGTHMAENRPGEARRAMTELTAELARTDPLLAGTRRAALEAIAGLHGLEAAAPVAPAPALATAPAAGLPPGAAPLRMLVSGIGRSGTTLIYQQLAKLLLETGAVNFRYEPYLWNIHTPGTAGNAFGTEQLHHFGLATHLATPLFLDGPHPDHDRFLDHLFAAPLDDDPAQAPAACLTKVIRGSGRLRAYLARFPDLKLVICLRNPLDTINSSLGMFSFFGEEFHENDRDRFAAELAARGRLDTPLPAARNAVEWYGAWWRAFTEESLAVAADFPDNTFLFCHEQFQADSRAVLGALQDFAGLANDGIWMDLDRPAGPSIRATSLTAHDIRALRDQTEWYRDTVLTRHLGAEAAAERTNRMGAKYGAGRFSFPVAGSDPGRMSTIQLRSLILGGGSSPFLKLAQGPRSPVALAPLLEAHGASAPAPAPDALRHGKRFGVVITCHNNADTIADAVLSCLNQTLPFDEILVVDDRSTDASRDILRVLADRYAPVRLVELESSLGPAAARDLGIRRLTTDFFTQLDGDDQFWPTKNAAEAAAIKGEETAVAFSDILLVLPGGKAPVQSTAAYDLPAGPQLYARMLARTPQIPRDMTLARARYFEAGGYNPLLRLYEDWDFKLRLAALEGGEWRRAEGLAGTVYNRLTPGLSGVDPGRHARALSLIFLTALGTGLVAPQGVLAGFDTALRPFADRNLTRRIRAWLADELDSGRFDPRATAARAAARRLASLDNAALAAEFALPATATRTVPEQA